MCARYRKTVGEWKDIENDFYANGSPNDDLERERFRKAPEDAPYVMIEIEI